MLKLVCEWVLNRKAVASLGFIILVSGSGCISDSAQKSPPQYELTIKDLSAVHLFDISLRSNDKRTLCLETYKWDGNFCTENTSLKFDNGEMKPRLCSAIVLDDDCPFGRVLMLRSGEIIHKTLLYDMFGNERMIDILKNKKLTFQVEPHVCTKNELNWLHAIETKRIHSWECPKN